MKNLFSKRLAIILLLIIGVFHSYDSFSQPNFKISFDNNWLFSKTRDLAASNFGFNDKSWRKIIVPHDWSIEDTVSKANKSSIEGGFFVTGSAWYRKHFKVPLSWKNKMLTCRFDGIFFKIFDVIVIFNIQLVIVDFEIVSLNNRN
jgi:beta-galactosidase